MALRPTRRVDPLSNSGRRSRGQPFQQGIDSGECMKCSSTPSVRRTWVVAVPISRSCHARTHVNSIQTVAAASMVARYRPSPSRRPHGQLIRRILFGRHFERDFGVVDRSELFVAYLGFERHAVFVVIDSVSSSECHLRLARNRRAHERTGARTTATLIVWRQAHLPAAGACCPELVGGATAIVLRQTSSGVRLLFATASSNTIAPTLGRPSD